MPVSRKTITIRRDEWERFLAEVQDLIDLHSQLLKRSRELEIEYRPEKEKPTKTSRICINCNREISEIDRFCDRCGSRVVW